MAIGRRDLAAALDTLPPDQRAAVLLVDAYGLDYGEAADVLGVAAGTIGSRLSRARAALRAVLGRGPMSERDRDERLGEALRALDVPDHGPDFYPRLMARLEEEAARHPGSPRRRPRWTSPYLLTAAAAAVAVIVLATSTLFTGDGGGPPPVEPELITASVVRSRVADALASLETLRGEITLECEIYYGPCSPPEAGGRATLRWTFVTTAAGDERITGIGVPDDMATNSTTLTHRELPTSGAGPRATRRSTCPPDRPTSPRPLPPPPAAGLGGAGVRHRHVRRAGDRHRRAGTGRLAAGDPGGARTSWPARAGAGTSWRWWSTARAGSPCASPSRSRAGSSTRSACRDWWPTSPSTRPPSSSTSRPDVEVFRQDFGFRPVTLDEAAAVVGYRPLLPTDVPAGFELAEVTAAAQGRETGTEG